MVLIQTNEGQESEITWEDLYKLEPGLVELWTEAKEVEDNQRLKT